MEPGFGFITTDRMGAQLTPRGELDARPGVDGTLVLRLRPSVDGYNGLATGCGI